MKKIAVIGAGISGLASAHFLKEGCEVVVFESSPRSGGLIQCDIVEGHLYHKVGGHVFNSKLQDVLNWFWSFFDRDQEFHQATRNACIALDKELKVGYPIENHLHQLPASVAKDVLDDLLDLFKTGPNPPENFDEFLRARFGKTLFDLYFHPYNTKIWRRDLSKVSISWLEGKLPMPTVPEILLSNILKQPETEMVHSSFYYPKENGSQFIADRLSEGLDIRKGHPVIHMEPVSSGSGIRLNGNENFDAVIYTGNLQKLPGCLVTSLQNEQVNQDICKLEYHGTTTVLCETDPNPYSWIYLPDPSHRSHRMICTGNFAPSNNADNKQSATIEFTDEVGLEEIQATLPKLPYNPKYIDHRFTQYTYPIQYDDTRQIIQSAKQHFKQHNLYLTGRFAEWEYYNMDTAIAAAKNTCAAMLSGV